MFELLLVLTGAAIGLALLCAYDGSEDILHPIIFLGPMMFFLYVWMPTRLYIDGHLDGFLDGDQLVFAQTLNLLGVCAMLAGVLSVGFARRSTAATCVELPPRTGLRLVIGGCVVGTVGLGCWGIAIINVGGFVDAFSKSYAGGWDDSGYIRDGSLLLVAGVLLILAGSAWRMRALYTTLTAIFALPWITQALLTSRRGPTFAIVTVLAMGWYLTRGRRPASIAVILAGGMMGYLVLFLVTNRNNIHLGADLQDDMNTDVTQFVEGADTGNEYIYGAGSIFAAQRRDHYFWGRRYLAQLLVRPIPSSVWPTKYEDFGVPELLNNAGTGEGFEDALGWQGAIGSAPGIVADTWIEFHWLNLPFLFLLGVGYGYTWKKAIQKGGPWNTQFAILSALSIYMIMQTMEAIIFRSLELSIPSWLIWNWALKASADRELQAQSPDPAASGRPRWQTAGEADLYVH